MVFHLDIFSLFSALGVLCSFFVVAAGNPVHSVFFLIMVFCSASCLLLCLTVDFLSIIFIVIYVGAVAVLFLFVVMMLNIKLTELTESFVRFIPLGFFLGVAFFFELSLSISSSFAPGFGAELTPWVTLLHTNESVYLFGEIVYTHYLHVFILSGMVLLVSMLGTISLTLHHSINVRRQQVYRQVGRNSRSAVFLHKFKDVQG